MGKLNLLTSVLPSYTMTLPVTKTVVSFRPFVVKEEKVLLIALQSKNPKQIADALRNVILACTNSALDTKKIGVAESEYAFLQIRAKSVGEEVKPQVTCSSCGTSTTIKIKLDAIEMKKSDKEEVDSTVVLSDELSLVMRYPTIHDTSAKDGEVEEAFSLVESCIESVILKDQIYTRKDIDTKEITELIDNLLPDQFLKILDFVKSTPELNYTFLYNCPKCAEKVRVELSSITDFFQ